MTIGKQLSDTETEILREYFKALNSRLTGPGVQVSEEMLRSMTYRYQQVIEMAGDCPEHEIPRRAAQVRFGYLVGLHVQDILANSATSQEVH